MNAKYAVLAAACLALSTGVADAGRFGGGGFSRPAGGFDFHSDGAAAHPQSFSHSSTGPAGTQRTTTGTAGPNGYARTTTATNGDYSRTTNGGGNYNTGNYYHNSTGSGPYGSYSHSGSGNAYNHTYSGSTTATNAYGQTYHASTYANNGVVYHGATVSNPVWGAYPAWGWNGGIAWVPAPYYYGGGFWGAFAVGAVAYGAIAASAATYQSYQVTPESPGAKLLQSYKLTQVQCGPPNLVVIYGPNNSVICAEPNDLVAAGNYSVNSSSLTIVSEKPS